jgi:hypothetical protein
MRFSLLRGFGVCIEEVERRQAKVGIFPLHPNATRRN